MRPGTRADHCAHVAAAGEGAVESIVEAINAGQAPSVLRRNSPRDERMVFVAQTSECDSQGCVAILIGILEDEIAAMTVGAMNLRDVSQGAAEGQRFRPFAGFTEQPAAKSRRLGGGTVMVGLRRKKLDNRSMLPNVAPVWSASRIPRCAGPGSRWTPAPLCERASGAAVPRRALLRR
jgi:hypothetical protein